ncbi:MAG: DNA-binding response regulator BaeS [Osedax symbiont Rs2]|nr:MAG: DNA-binding response regulator BaeS [Osedax symbiont Rs2]
MSSRAARVLIVEDERKLARVLAEYLTAANYQTHCLYSGDQVMPWLVGNNTDLIILDLMLPKVDGISLCAQIRQQSEVPILLATAKVTEEDRLLGWQQGADDYICKPYSMREMVARVTATLRRAKPQEHSKFTQPFQVDVQKMQIHAAGVLLQLTAVEFRLLNHLISHPQIIFSRDQLLDVIYDDYRFVSNRTIDSHIKNLRKKLTSLFQGEEMIQSIYGVGYKFSPQ